MSGRSVGSAVLASLLVVSCWIGLSSGKGVAQQPPPQKLITIDYEHLDISEAVARFFKHFNVRYTLAQDVKGTVTAQLSNVSLEQALPNLLVQVNATWRVREGVYEIVRKRDEEPIDWAANAEAERRLNGEDVRVAINRLFGNDGIPVVISPEIKGRIKLDEKEMKGLTFEAALQRVLKGINATCRVVDGVYEILPLANQDPGQKIVNISFEAEDVREAIRKLFRSVDGVPYSIAVEVQGTVSVDFKNTKFNDALATMLSQVNATFQVETGIYQIILRPTRTFKVGKPDPSDHRIVVQEEAQGPVTMTQDNKFIYILRGEVLYKVNKSDLKTVAMGRLGQ